jgi:hypothetical protein
MCGHPHSFLFLDAGAPGHRAFHASGPGSQDEAASSAIAPSGCFFCFFAVVHFYLLFPGCFLTPGLIPRLKLMRLLLFLPGGATLSNDFFQCFLARKKIPDHKTNISPIVCRALLEFSRNPSGSFDAEIRTESTHFDARKFLKTDSASECGAAQCGVHVQNDLKAESIAGWGDELLQLNRRFGINILGGCCGTGGGHLRWSGARLRLRSAAAVGASRPFFMRSTMPPPARRL